MFKTKIKYLLKDKKCQIEKHGEWIDLRSQEELHIQPWREKLIPLGVVLDMPKYHEAHILPRSSTWKKFCVVLVNSQGVIESDYCGINDVLRFPAKALDKPSYIRKYDRICQFRVMLTQDAPWYVKLKWLFSTYVFEEVDVLNNKDRGGFGQSGHK